MDAIGKARKSLGNYQSSKHGILTEPETAIDTSTAFKNRDKGVAGKPLKSNFGVVKDEQTSLEANLNQPQMTRSKPMQKASTAKDIASAMVRLNT